ncbi:MAG TPA: Ig-like domain-containing protein, partial [Pseudomonadales bacterium]|nr:Ig-like domain-containing protein [Pseudomonadales bacterium]
VRFAFGDTLSTTIDAGAHTIAVLQPSGTDLSGLSDPTIVVSLGGTVAAQGSEDFTNNVVYTVTAQDGTTVDWTVTVTAAASTASTAANITSSVSNLITSMLINKNQHAVVGGVASLDDLASLDQVADPTDIFGISDGASVALVSGSYQLGTAKYMITAEDGTTTNEWSVLFRVNDPQQQPAFSIANGNLSLLVNSAPVQLQTSGGISTAARTFASSNTAVVTVDDQGTLTVVGPGSATITASKDRLVTRVVEYLSASTSIDVAVEKLEQTMLQFSSDAISVALSSAASNDLTGGNGSGALSFTSSDESVATVGADGTITVLAVGATTITADKAGDNTYLASNTASYVLTVTEDPTTTTPTCVLDQSKWDECQID